MGSNKRLLLIHKEMASLSLNQLINVMLTPQFYTMKKEALPIKYHYQAKRIAPSLFDGLLESEKQYAFFVFKEEENWVFIAYNPEEIRTFLESKGLSLEYVSEVFFAQQAKEAFIDPFILSEKEVLLTIDDIVTVIPRAVLSQEYSSVHFDEQFTPKSGVSLSSSRYTLLNQKEALILSTIFTLFAGAFFLEGWKAQQSVKIEQQKIATLFEAYPSLQSKMQRESIGLKYQTIDTKERHKRDTIKTLASFLFKGVTLTSYEMKKTHFKAVFTCENQKIRDKLYAFAKKSHFKVTEGKGTHVVVIEGRL